MWLMVDKSWRRKNIRDPRMATGRYMRRCSSRDFCSRVDSSRDSDMVLLLTLASFSDSRSSLFSKMFPWDVARVCRSIFSRDASWSLRSSSCFRRELFCCSSSGCSCWMVSPRSCTSSPNSVVVKFAIVMRDAASGGIVGAEARVIRYREKPL